MSKVVVAFDLYGTLLSTASIAKQLATHFGEQIAQSIAATWRKYQLEYTWRFNSMGKYEDFFTITKNSLQHALAEHDVSLAVDAIDGLMEAYDSLSTFPDVDQTLKELASNTNIECAVFSNGTKEMVSNSVQKSPDLGRHSSVFKHIVTVDSVRAFKPAPKVYEHLAESVGLKQHMGSIWLVSGNPFDIVGARAMGMQAAWIDRAGSGWQDRQGGEPTIVVNSLEKVAKAVEEYAARNT